MKPSYLRPLQQKSAAHQVLGSPIQGSGGGDLFVSGGESGFHDFNAAKALGRRLKELGQQQRAGQGSSVMFGQQVGGDDDFLKKLKDGLDHISGRKVHHDVMGLKGFDVRGNPIETAVIEQALKDIQSTKTGKHLLQKLSDSGYKIQFMTKKDLRMRNGEKRKGVTADPGFRKGSDGNYALKKKSLVITLDLEDIQSGKMGSFNDRMRNVVSHELGHAYQNIFHPNDVIWGRNDGPQRLEEYARNQWELPIKTEFNQNAGLWPMSLPDRRPDTKVP